MNIRQFQLLSQVAECDLNISRTARTAHTSQPTVSRHLQALENQLGVRIFIRKKRKVIGLTATGKQVLQSARRVLYEIESMSELSTKTTADQHGSITIAASHTYARYSLPSVVRTFIQRYPNVRFILRQGDPHQILTWATTGAVDVAVCAEPKERPKELVFFSCNRHERLILTPAGHPLGKLKKPSLYQLSKYPLITYDSQFAIHQTILGAFEAEGLTPNIVLTATDVDVMKTYVKCGLGVAVVPSLAYTKAEDRGLVAVNANHLLEPMTIKVGLRKDTFLRSFVYDFIEMFAPMLKRDQIRRALAPD
jgi:LysR family cys regulon transcriptional activator